MKVEIGNYPTHRFYHRWFGWEAKERISVHIDPWDTWSMDWTLSNIVVPMLRQLKATAHGAPFVDLQDRPTHLVPAAVSRGSRDVDPFHMDAWDWVLDEMLFAHQSKLEEWEDQFYSGDPAAIWKELTCGCSELVTTPKDTFKVDWDGRKAYQTRINEGFRLFGKYYENLWD